jgi:putative membrane protein
VVALDWLQTQGLRLLIELGCRLADWPVVLRGEEMQKHSDQGHWVYQPMEGRRYLRQVMQATARLLRAGEVLVIFPEGYPNIDPHPTPKRDLTVFLPFQPGMVKMAERAQKDGRTRVALVPAGLSYTRGRGKHWRIHVRFGPPLFLEDFASSQQALHAIEERVHALSAPQPDLVQQASLEEPPHAR